MLRISRLTDYAVVLSSLLADAQQPTTVRDLAEASGIPQPTVSKVLKQLTRAGVVRSQRGVHGGYSLARQADKVGVHEIIEAIEGPIAVTECTDEQSDTDCAYETNCGVRANWQRINQAVQRALSGITLGDMAASVTPPLVTLRVKGS